MRQLPKESIIYLGDTLRCPYGTKSENEIFQYTLEMVDFLIEKDIKFLIIACNTATAYTLEYLQGNINIPVIGVIQPGARTAIKTTINNNIGVIATDATIDSNAYKIALQNINPEVHVINKACSEFVPMIESGYLDGEKADIIVENALSIYKNKDIDTLILGCTHYPLIKNTIEKHMNKGVTIISSGEETARETSVLLEYHQLLNQTKGISKYTFYTTGNSNVFAELANTLFKQSLPTVKSINIEKVII